MDKRRRVWLLAAAVLAVCAALLALTACGDDDDSAGNETTPAATAPAFPEGSTMARIQQRGKIVVGTKFDQPLFGLKDPRNDEINGFDIEIANLIAKGIFGDDIEGKVEFVETPTPTREVAIRQGSVDIVVATYTINDERKQQVDFAGPYYVAGQDIMVRADNEDITSVGDLNGKKVCSVQGSTSLDNVRREAPDADTSLNFRIYSQCASALGDGRVEAVTTDNVILLGLAQASDGAYKLVGDRFTEEPYGIGLRRGDTDFRAFINDRLQEIEDSGEWAAAFESTVGQAGEATPEPPPIDRY